MVEASETPRLLKPREAAELLAISERTLWTLTKQGVIPCVRLGRSVRYRLSELVRQLDALGADQTDTLPKRSNPSA